MNRTLELIALGKDQASAVLGKVGGAVSGLGSIAAGVATGGLALAGAAIVAVGAAAVGAGVAIFSFSQDTDKAMKLFGAQTGIAADELGEFKDVAKDVYAAGLGESIEEVVEQMSLVHRGLGETGQALEDSTRRAMTLADVFEIDVAESIKWVSSMTQSWGMSSEDAFDVLTKGMQMGLDVADDLGDTLNEYSSDFDRLGFTADQTLSILNAGLEAGAFNTDVIADGFREYGIRLTEGGDTMTAVFDQMGLDFEGMSASVAAGDESWGDYSGTIVEGLLGIENELERNAAGAAIFGSKWEDVGGDVFLAAGMATDGIEGVGGATDAAGEQMATGLGPALERLKRTFLTEFAPLGDLVGGVIADKIVPLLTTAAEWIGEKAPGAIKWLTEKFEEYWPIIQSKVSDFWESAKPILEDTKEWLGKKVPEAIKWLVKKSQELSKYWKDTLRPALVKVHKFVKDNMTPILAGLGAIIAVVVIPAFIAWAAGAIAAAGATIAALAPVLIPIAAIGLAVGLLVAAWENDWGGIKTFFIGVWEDHLKPAFESMKDWFQDKIPKALNFLKGKVDWIKGKFDDLKDTFDNVKDAIKGVWDWIANLKDSFSGLSLPSWLTPGSATPLELGLLGIGDAFAKLDRMPSINWMTQTTGGGQGAGSASGAPIYVVNNFGRDSVRSDEDIRSIIDSIQTSLELQGVRGRIA